MDHHAEEEHILSYRALAAVLGILLVLTAVTVAASRVDLGALNIWVAILIAATKSSFVLLFFMHLRYESRLLKTTFLITIVMLALLIAFMFWDVSFR
jgi:cytochrome c oxidase subunit 4